MAWSRLRRYRSSVLDRSFANDRTVAAIGPLADIDRDAMRSVLDAAFRSPHSPLTLIPTEQRSWDRDCSRTLPILDVPAPPTVSDTPGARMGEVIDAALRRPGPRRAFELVVVDNHVVVDYSHGIGDGRFGVALVVALVNHHRTGLVAATAPTLPRYALVTALRAQFAGNPTRLKQLREQRALHRSEPPKPTIEIADWPDHLHTASAVMSPAVAAQLHTWKATRYGGNASSASTIVAAARAAFADAGETLSSRMFTAVDLRRYLPERHRGANGNFSVLVPLRADRPMTPADVRTSTRAAIDSAWPLAIAASGELKSRLRRLPTKHRSAMATDGLELAVSDLGSIPYFHDLPRYHGMPLQGGATMEPGSPSGIIIYVFRLADEISFTISYCSKVISHEAVSAILRALTTRPIELLEALDPRN